MRFCVLSTLTLEIQVEKGSLVVQEIWAEGVSRTLAICRGGGIFSGITQHTPFHV